MALIDLLPVYYTQSSEVLEIQESLNYVIDILKANKEDLLKQLNIESATWGLEKWEETVGLDTDISKPFEFRRERIKAKIRGIGTINKQMIVDTARSYSNGEVEVIEDPANYSFKIRFVGTKGLPPNMTDLTLTIEEIKPAHLTYTFEYVYRTHAELIGYTHGQLSIYTHAELREGEMS